MTPASMNIILQKFARPILWWISGARDVVVRSMNEPSAVGKSLEVNT